MRGVTLMALSNKFGPMVVTTGNKSEMSVGYATLYGDMCGGISLIGDVSKIDVYRLARHVNRRHGSEKIPEAAFRIVPSAELAADQFDPFDYAVVAPLVGEMVERRRNAADLLGLFEQRALDPDRFLPDDDGRTVYDKHTLATFKSVLDDTAGRLRRSVYKRLQGPPIVIVSERAFGFDLRETIINGFRGE
jgi:NAD+ synthase (glutamine-hydrolysing)